MTFMRLVIQRVNKASVSVRGKAVARVGKGLFILVGLAQDDTRDDVEKLAKKVSKLRIMADENGKINLSIKEVQGQVLAVSQFTLLADTSKGNRPSFVKAARPQKAEELYNYFVHSLKKLSLAVETGKFGAYMKISAELDGPVTIIVDSSK